MNDPLDGRQRRIADLAHEVLPVLERREQRSKLARTLNQTMVLMLVAFAIFTGAERLRPINAAEERSLKVLLEYAAQKNAVSAKARLQKLLDHFQVKSLGEISAYQWNKAMACLSKNSE